MLAAWKTALVVMGLGATAWAQNGPSQAAPPDLPAPSAPDANRPLAVNTATYEIGPQDLLFVDVWKHEEFTRQHRVRPDGKITIPLVGDVQAAGLSPERLGAQLKEALAEYINEPVVSVSVLDVQSKTYKMAGAIAKPGTYPMPNPIRVFDAINNAGGFPPNSFANKKKIIIIRENSPERFIFNYEDYIKGKNLDKNIYLQNGDTVFVEE